MSPTARSLAWLRARGYTAVVAERWNPHARIRQDLGGWMDILAWGKEGILGVQCCAVGDLAKREAKMLAAKTLGSWLDAGGKAVLMGWGQRGARGEKKVWALTVVHFLGPGAPEARILTGAAVVQWRIVEYDREATDPRENPMGAPVAPCEVTGRTRSGRHPHG